MRVRSRSNKSRAWSWLFGFVGCLCVGVAVAEARESRFDISSDGTNVDFDVRDVPRREVLNRLFADRGIKLEWLNRGFADEPISGTFNGTPTSVVRQLLTRTNFVIIYGPKDKGFQITRVVVVGRAGPGQNSPGLAAIEAAVQPSSPSRAASPAPRPGNAITDRDTQRRAERDRSGQVAAHPAPLQRPGPVPVGRLDPSLTPAPSTSASLPPFGAVSVTAETARSFVTPLATTTTVPTNLPATRPPPGAEAPASGAGPVPAGTGRAGG